jgi:very-short-patch-repair endonuclease
MWSRLKRRQVLGFKFRRQHCLGAAIVDFYCPSARLAVEVDGPVHELQREHDARRDAHLRTMGIDVLRVTSTDVCTNLDAVVDRIARRLRPTT